MYQFGHAIWLAYHNLIQGRVVDVHGAEDVFTYYERIGELEDKLGGKGFFRCHKSYVEVKNSMDKAEKFTGGFTNKGDSQEHGIGLLNVSDVVHGYDGALNAEAENGIFLISVLIPFPDAIHDIKTAV